MSNIHKLYAITHSLYSGRARAYRFFLLQRVQQVYPSIDASAKEGVDDMLAACGLAELLQVKLQRQLSQEGNLEVWV